MSTDHDRPDGRERAADSARPGGEGRFVDDYLPFLLAQASARISAEFHHEVADAGLSVTQWRVLASLEGSRGETVGRLGELTLTKQPTLSKVVLRMEADGLLRRDRLGPDRRQTVVRATSKGRRLSSTLLASARAHQASVLAPFGQDKARLLIAMLGDLMSLHPAVDAAADRRRRSGARPKSRNAAGLDQKL